MRGPWQTWRTCETAQLVHQSNPGILQFRLVTQLPHVTLATHMLNASCVQDLVLCMTPEVPYLGKPPCMEPIRLLYPADAVTVLSPLFQKFVTGLLGVADDMERALESVPADAAQHKDPAALLKGLRDGIALTHRTLEKVSLAKCSTHMMQATLNAAALAYSIRCWQPQQNLVVHTLKMCSRLPSQSQAPSKLRRGTLSDDAP